MKNHCLFSASLVIVAMVIIGYLYHTRAYKLSIECTANLLQQSEHEQYSMLTAIKLEYRPDGTLTAVMDGKIQLADNTYTLKRRIQGRYHYEDKNVYRLNENKIYLAGSDDVPLEVFRKYFFNLKPKQDMFFTVSRVENQWVIGTPYMPAFICEN